MLRYILALVATLVALAGHAATIYTLSEPFAVPLKQNYEPPCVVGTCANYSADTRITGWFKTSAPLPPNLSAANVFPFLLAWSFSDGINTYSSSDPNARVFRFQVWTSGTGQLVTQVIWMSVWTSGRAPHTLGDRVNAFIVNGSFATLSNNSTCSVMPSDGFSAETGVADVCSAPKGDASTSTAETPIAECAQCGRPRPVWAQDTVADPPPRPIPALSPALLALLSALVAAAALLRGRR